MYEPKDIIDFLEKQFAVAVVTNRVPVPASIIPKCSKITG
jgi:hypothetical protein